MRMRKGTEYKASPAPPPRLHPHTPNTTNYNEKLEETLMYPHPIMRRIPLPSRRMSRSADNSPDVIKRVRHDNNNDQPQVLDFFKNSTTVNNTRAHKEQGNRNDISNSSSSPSPRLIDEVKNKTLDMICPFNPDIDRSADDTPPHHHRALGGGPPSRACSTEADDRTPPPQLVYPFISPDTQLFQPSHNYNYSIAITDPSALSGLPSPLDPDSMAHTSQVGLLGAVHRCEVCGKLLSTRLTLKRHTEQQHLQPQHSARCSLCHKVFRTLNSLINHKSIYHRHQRGLPQHTPAAVPAPAPLAALAKPQNLSTGVDAKLAPPPQAIDFYKISLTSKLLPSNRSCTFYV